MWRKTDKKVDVREASNPICDEDFVLKKVIKDHCHLTGNLEGLANNECNLTTKKAHSSSAPIVFHIFFGYDCHLIFEKLVKMAIEKGIEKKEEIF